MGRLMMTKRNEDIQKRFRCYTKGFRISPEENEMINRKIALSGLTSQEYLCQCVLNHDVTINGNPYVYRSLKKEINHFIDVFNKVESIKDIVLDELEILEYMLKIVISMRKEKVAHFKADKDSF